MIGESKKSFRALWRHHLKRLSRVRRAQVFGGALSVIATISTVALACLWWTGRMELAWVALSWVIATGASLALATFLGKPDRLAKERELRHLDEVHGAKSAYLVAGQSEQRTKEQRLLPLVQRHADRVAATHPADDTNQGRRLRFPLSLLVALLFLSMLLGVVPKQALMSMTESLRINFQEKLSGGANKPPSEDDQEQNPDPSRESLDQILLLTVNSRHRMYRVGEMVPVQLGMKPRIPLPMDLHLETVILVGNGDATPDEGFGVGLRAHDMPEPFVVAAGNTDGLYEMFDLQPILKDKDLERPGFIFVEFRGRDLKGAIPGTCGSNRLLIQIVDDREDQRARKREQVGDQTMDPQEKEEENEQDPGMEGGVPPEQGPPQRLPEVAFEDMAVEPLLASDDQIKKEVEVFDAKRAHPQERPPPRATPSVRLPVREYLKQSETLIDELPFSAEDRQILRRYFEVLRRGR